MVLRYFFMFFQTSATVRGHYRSNYSIDHLDNAYKLVTEENVSGQRTAARWGVPVSTLKDRLLGNISLDTVKSGPMPLFTATQESFLASHSRVMGEIGYGYTRQETSNLASYYAVHLGYRDRSHPLSLRWLYSFIDRWPELKVQKPRKLEAARARSATKENILRYFEELSQVIKKHCLDNSPIMLPSTSTRKASLPTLHPRRLLPVLIARHRPEELLSEAAPGASGTVSETGWSNADVFSTYMKDHLAKYLPAHHLDYSLSFISGRAISKHDICGIACKVFNSTLTPINIVSSFRKSVIHPFNSEVVDDLLVMPARSFTRPPPSDSEGNAVVTNTDCAARDFLECRDGVTRFDQTYRHRCIFTNSHIYNISVWSV
ncbi:uncharacterized protein LOC125376196 [Haliotis rufescens]|uniref:uncharacterized protein LOC125376196 n=1 Tax=Haliotis rufescens TaxID=6454 RepID=UPI00201EC6ED|nr:uncharacterized protein LOC125376196 [Haliotis rufescens]